MEDINRTSEAPDPGDVTLSLDWLAKMVNKITARVEQNRVTLREIFGFMKDASDQIREQENEIEIFKETNVKLEPKVETTKDDFAIEVDEVRQRGLKGNIIVSSPSIPGREGGK